MTFEQPTAVINSADDLMNLQLSHEGEIGMEFKNVVVPSPISTICSIEENVFSIDHVLEAIFKRLKFDRQTLLKSRLVSRRWAYFGSKAVQKIVEIQFELPHRSVGPLIYTLSESRRKNSSWKKCSLKGCSLGAMTAVINNSVEFPCTSFTFLNNDDFYKIQAQVTSQTQSFLESHGTRVKFLKMSGCLCLNQVKSLLLTQAPNLEGFAVFNFSKCCRSFNKKSPLLYYCELDIENIHLWNGNYMRQKPTLKHLKVFICNLDILPTLVQQILECSPNLTRVMLPSHSFHYLLKSLNQAHLLKSLLIHMDMPNMESLECFANHHEDKLALERIFFTHSFERIDRDLHPRALDIMNKIVKGSSATCQKLVMLKILKGFKAPPMPHLEFLSFVFECPDDDFALPGKISPARNIGLGDIFPKLKELEIKSGSYESQYISIETIFGETNPRPVLHVKKVYLRFKSDQDFVDRFREIFPNAIIDYELV